MNTKTPTDNQLQELFDFKNDIYEAYDGLADKSPEQFLGAVRYILHKRKTLQTFLRKERANGSAS